MKSILSGPTRLIFHTWDCGMNTFCIAASSYQTFSRKLTKVWIFPIGSSLIRWRRLSTFSSKRRVRPCTCRRHQIIILSHALLFVTIWTIHYTLKMGITFGNGSFVPNLLRQVFHSQIKIQCESHSNKEKKSLIFYKILSECVVLIRI